MNRRTAERLLELSDSLAIRLAGIAAGALLATSLCFYMALGLLNHELGADIVIEPAPFVSPAILADPEEKKPPQRVRVQKILPAEPPAKQGVLPAPPPVDDVERVALRPNFGSLADLLGNDIIQLEVTPPISDLVPLVVVQPAYPLAAIMRNIEGFVIVQFSVRENGTVANPFVLDSEPAVLFDEAALSAASRLRFKPRAIGDDPLAVASVQMKFAFNLDRTYEIPPEARR